jgi:hypothetical protein
MLGIVEAIASPRILGWVGGTTKNNSCLKHKCYEAQDFSTQSLKIDKTFKKHLK